MRQNRLRARDFELIWPGQPGPTNSILDVPSVKVGLCTLWDDNRRIRTGVTLLSFADGSRSLPAAVHTLNGAGEVTGAHWIRESGILEGPIGLTNTHSLGIVRDSLIRLAIARDEKPKSTTFGSFTFHLPVVAETADIRLNDMDGFHVEYQHVSLAYENLGTSTAIEGSVGGGAGMVCHGWKGGNGTASRIVGDHILGVFVQANHGSAKRLTILGVPVGETILPAPSSDSAADGAGSIIVIVATSAPLDARQLGRLATRAMLGVGRTGGLGETASGDFSIAVSVAEDDAARLPEPSMDELFAAVVEATEEAIVNALFAGVDVYDGAQLVCEALPVEKVASVIKKEKAR